MITNVSMKVAKYKFLSLEGDEKSGLLINVDNIKIIMYKDNKLTIVVDGEDDYVSDCPFDVFNEIQSYFFEELFEDAEEESEDDEEEPGF